MSNLQENILNLLSKKLEVTFGDQTHTLHVIDWTSIVTAHEAIMEQIESMEEEEAGEFLCDNETELIQITEYFMNDACDEKVEEEQWLPIGLLGLSHHPVSYAETGHSGLLLLDKSKGKRNNPSVILFYNKKVQVVAESFAELTIKELND